MVIIQQTEQTSLAGATSAHDSACAGDAQRDRIEHDRRHVAVHNPNGGGQHG
jgi:hypothetical protein